MSTVTQVTLRFVAQVTMSPMRQNLDTGEDSEDELPASTARGAAGDDGDMAAIIQELEAAMPPEQLAHFAKRRPKGAPPGDPS